MGTHPHPAFRIWGTILIGLFLMFGGASLAYAQDETSSPEPELISEEVGEEVSEDEEEAVVDLAETSRRLAELEAIEQERGPSIDSASVRAVKDLSVQLGVFGFLFLLLLVQIAFLVREGSAYSKKLVFGLMVFVIAAPTLYFVASTIFVNVISVTKGPVHWHADFKIHACGLELPPPEPAGKLSNKTGTAVLHQHEDERVHVEGVVVDYADVNLQNFFAVQGGEMTRNSITVPTGTGFKTFTNGDLCGDGTRGVWNVFLYKTDVTDNTITKSKLDNFPEYVLSPHISVPPGDCIIFEFGENIDDTNKICNFTQIEINKGNVTPTWNQQQ